MIRTGTRFFVSGWCSRNWILMEGGGQIGVGRSGFGDTGARGLACCPRSPDGLARCLSIVSISRGLLGHRA